MRPARDLLALVAAAATLASASATARAEEPQALVVPISGTVKGPLAGATADFTRELNEIMAERGAVPVAARIERKELGAIAGCSDDSAGCLGSIADAMGVDTVVLGQAQNTAEGDVAVSLTVFTRGEEPVRTVIVLGGGDRAEATREFGRKARAVLDGEPAPAPTPEPTPEPALTPEPAPPEPVPGDGFDFARVAPTSYALAGGGVVLFGLGAVFYGLASSKQAAIDDAPTASLEDLRALEALESRGKTYAVLGNVGTIVGGVAAAVGVTLIVLQGRSGESPPRAAVTPTAMRDGAGLTLTVRGDL